MKLNEKKLLVLSIFIVFLASWSIGNLMDLRIEEGTEVALLSGLTRDVFYGSSLLLIFIPLSYLSYVYLRSGADRVTVLSDFLLAGFWIFAFFGGLILVISGFWPLTLLFDFLPNVPIPFDIGGALPHLYLDVGFILLLSLLSLLFSIYIYLKFGERRMDKEKGNLNISTFENDIYSEEGIEKQTIEDSLTSTLDRAITDIDEGEDIRSTIMKSYHEMSRLLEDEGAKNDDSMTPREFKAEIIQKIPAAENLVSDITFLFEEARYSPHELEERDKKQVIQQLEELKGELL